MTVVGYVATDQMLCVQCAHVAYPLLDARVRVRDGKGNLLIPLHPRECAEGDQCGVCWDLIG